MKKIAIITSGVFPVPPTKGGAVENLIQNVITENEKDKKLSLYIFSIGDKQAQKISSNFKNTKFYFVNIPQIISFLNIMIFFFFSKILHKKKVMSYRFIAQRLFYLYKVAVILRNENFDKIVLENHTTLYLSLKLFKNYKKYKGNYLYHMHNVITNLYGCENIIANTSEVIGVSNYILGTFKISVPNYSKKMKFTILKNQVDGISFKTKYTKQELNDERIKLKISNDKKIVLFTGRMNEEKGINELLLAWNHINIRNAVLVVVGAYYYKSGIQNEKFFNEIDTLVKHTKNLIFTGYVNYAEIPKLYAVADLVVLPSMWEDPAPLTVIEALTSGKPLITTNSGGIPEYAAGAGAIILKKENPDFVSKLADAIKNILNSNKEMDNMAERAKLWTKDWSTKKYFMNFCDILNQGC